MLIIKKEVVPTPVPPLFCFIVDILTIDSYMNRNPKVLLVEDDKVFGAIVKQRLEEAGYNVDHCYDGNEAWSLYDSVRYDICLLDIVLPGRNGFELAKEIRNSTMLTPIFFLTSERVQEEDRLEGFSLGGDGYLIKPFSFEELLRRMQVILKWTRPPRTELTIGHSLGMYTYHYHKLRIFETESKQVKCKLSPIEAKMLRYFLSRPNIIVQKDEVLLRVWGKEDFYASRSMDVFIGRIRKQLKLEPRVELETVYNVGLRLNVPDTLLPVRISVPLNS
ncbi:DNA-binding response regulator, OmpR family, contains REC and winged-helix (WHTH) domain [Chitinophaga sp. 180180018-2]|nr:DNA-binding response regulator, OmpR family, contains REC and winged-helix (WHTH) domain [Chitinophaga sp. 212800010-3]